MFRSCLSPIAGTSNAMSPRVRYRHDVDRQELLDEIRRNIRHTRDGGGQPTKVRMHPKLRQLVEAEYAVEHKDGQMFIGGVLLIGDEAVPYGEYEIDSV